MCVCVCVSLSCHELILDLKGSVFQISRVLTDVCLIQ